jgi:phage gpG-like protein
MPNISIDIIGKKLLQKGFTKLGRGLIDLRPVWSSIRDRFFDIETKRFASQGTGAKWRPLNPEYKAWKDKKYPGTTTMIRTGNLAASLTSMTKDTVYKSEKREMTIGTKLFYAIFHQFGYKTRGTKGQNRVPARKLITIRKSEQKTFVTRMEKYIKSITKSMRKR